MSQHPPHSGTPQDGSAPPDSSSAHLKTLPAGWAQAIHWDAAGLIPAIAQDHRDGTVLMVAWMNAEALSETLRTQRAVYWSRSRGRLWRKGEESGHTQSVLSVRLDCDQDVLLLQVVQAGGIACHTGRRSCFHLAWEHGQWQDCAPVLRSPDDIYAGAPAPAPLRPVMAEPSAEPSTDTLTRVADTIESRQGAAASSSYVASLFSKGLDAILKKVGEESTELVMAAKDGVPQRVVSETADLWFHTLVLLAHCGLRPDDVLAELQRREGISGLTEKAQRSQPPPS